MIRVNLMKMYNALSVCNSIISDKNGAAVVKVNETSMDICTADANRRYIKRMEIMNDGATCTQFILPLNRSIEILANYIPADGIQAGDLNLDISEEGVLKISCEFTYSDKFDESIAGKVCNELTNKLAVESASSPKRVLLARSNYEELLDEPAESDSWKVSDFRDFLNKLIIDKQTKNIYISSNKGKMFALGRNQLSMFKIPDIKFGFILDVNIAKSVIDALAKVESDTVEVYAAEGGKYITFLDRDGGSALWVCGSPASRGDVTKVDMYTNPELKYIDYAGVLLRVAFSTIINNIISSDKADNQKIDLLDTGTEDAKIKLSNVSAGGSIDNQFMANFLNFGMADQTRGDLNGTVVVQTLKDIMSMCKGDFVAVRVQCNDEYAMLKINDLDKASGDDVVSSHYTLISTKQM